MSEKEEILIQLELFLTKELPIGKSFQEFNELMEKWKNSATIEGKQFHKINIKFQQLREAFFYKISIYKELQEYDLKINLQRKLALIEKIGLLEKESSIKKCELLLKDYHIEWNTIGASPKESFKNLGDQFYKSVRTINEKINKHYDRLKEDRKKNLELKKKLLESTKNLLSIEIKTDDDWHDKTIRLKKFQSDWKEIGFSSQKPSDKIWKQFRQLCDDFFNDKSKFFALQNQLLTDRKSQKEELIKEAKILQYSEQWRETTLLFVEMQRQWELIGPTFQRDEQKLWLEFKLACDYFFERNKKQLK